MLAISKFVMENHKTIRENKELAKEVILNLKDDRDTGISNKSIELQSLFNIN